MHLVPPGGVTGGEFTFQAGRLIYELPGSGLVLTIAKRF